MQLSVTLPAPMGGTVQDLILVSVQTHGKEITANKVTPRRISPEMIQHRMPQLSVTLPALMEGTAQDSTPASVQSNGRETTANNVIEAVTRTFYVLIYTCSCVWS